MCRRMLVLVMALALSTATAAQAQNTKHFSLGAGVSFQKYSDSRLKAKELDIVPMYRLSRGGGENGWDWDLKGSTSFSAVDIPSDVAGDAVRLGKLRTIPLLLGIERQYRHGPMKIGAYVTGGPSINNFKVDDGARQAYTAAGSSLEGVHAKTSIAFKPGVSASYRVSSLLALQGSVSYTVNRAKVTTEVDGVSTSETWKLDRSSARLGMVLGIF